MLRQLIIPFSILGILASILVPLPTPLMDFLLVGNLLFALVLLISTLYLSDPLKLSSLPTILLLATLYRLALNISTTRLILGHGDAGRVVEAFGAVVIQGNIAVGIVIFAVITLVQFIVVAKGSERVAEVSARFTLDALPGKQMAIDADVRAGLIDLETARAKRQELQVESRFYGALDGAMKFVKGDAIAAIAIVIINLVGGLLLGILSEGLDVSHAVAKYSVLSVGDGLLAQIPALLSSLAAGIVVTRVVSADGLPPASEVIAQLGQVRAVKIMIGLLSLGLAFAPGIPGWPFLVVAVLLLTSALLEKRGEKLAKSETKSVFQPRLPALFEIELTRDLARAFSKLPVLNDRIDGWRQEQHKRHGFILNRPELSLLDGTGYAFRLLMRGVAATSAVLDGELEKISVPAEKASAALNTLLASLTRLLDERKAECVDDILTRRTLDFFERLAPELAAAVVPGVVTITQLTFILKNLAAEDVPIKNFDVILQAISEASSKAGSDKVLLQAVRIALSRVISAELGGRKLRVVALDPLLDVAVATAAQSGRQPDPEQMSLILETLANYDDGQTIAVCSSHSRFAIKEALRIRASGMRVLAHEELASGLTFEWIEPREWRRSDFDQRTLNLLAAAA